MIDCFSLVRLGAQAHISLVIMELCHSLAHMHKYQSMEIFESNIQAFFLLLKGTYANLIMLLGFLHFLIKIIFYVICICVVHACIFVYHIQAWHTRKQEGFFLCSGTKVTTSSEPPCGC